MDYDEHSYIYDDNGVASFGSYNEYRGQDIHSVYTLTTTYNVNEHYFSFDDESISLAQNHTSTTSMIVYLFLMMRIQFLMK